MKPLNAYFNLGKLGTSSNLYFENFYGETSSAIERGLPTDRLLARWDLKHAYVDERLEFGPPRHDLRKELRKYSTINSLESLGPGITQSSPLKLNLTGLSWKPVFGLPAQETYQTQPNTVATLCALLVGAGARRVVVLENLYWDKPFEQVLTEAGFAEVVDPLTALAVSQNVVSASKSGPACWASGTPRSRSEAPLGSRWAASLPSTMGGGMLSGWWPCRV
jgi:hypothetical protein